MKPESTGLANRHAAHPGTAVLRGTLAGAAATLPMTAVMIALGQLNKRQRHEPFPPRRVTAGLLNRSGIWKRSGKRRRSLLTQFGHFGFGAFSGAIYGVYTALQPSNRASEGIGYGLLIWAGSYAGWLPALRIVAPPWQVPASRTLQMITAHIVWGAGLSWCIDWQRKHA